MSSRFGSAWESPGFLLWHATLRWQRMMRAALEPHGLTHVQFVLLASAWWIGDHEGSPAQRELADHAGTDPMMTSQVLRALEELGLVERERDPLDSRVLRISVTPQGRARVKGALRDVETADAAFFAPVGGAAFAKRLAPLAPVPR
jgi:DNA-binding MarR family transcriptional regulator